MAKNFIEAAREMQAKMDALKTQPPPLTVEDVQGIVIDVVRTNNVELVRVIRNNPVLVRPANGRS